MNAEQQRIAIAEWMGWMFDGTSSDLAYPGWYHATCKKALPNYPNDLNAMHEAEKKLSIKLPGVPHSQSERSRYVDLLFEMYGSKGGALASAAQRSEALCRTLWPERFNITDTKTNLLVN